MECLQRRMESVVLGLPSGSYAQRVQVRRLGGRGFAQAQPAPAKRVLQAPLLCWLARGCLASAARGKWHRQRHAPKLGILDPGSVASAPSVVLCATSPQAEYLKELEERAKAAFADLAQTEA